MKTRSPSLPAASASALLLAALLAGCSENKEIRVLVEPPESPAPVVVKEEPRNDGSIARKGAPMDMLLRWDEWDADGDGYADPAEQEAMREKLAVEATQPPEEKKEPEKVEVAIVPQEERAPRQDGREGGGGPGQFLATADANGDGMLSLEEAPGRMKERFSDLDTNGDGFVDQAEMEALRDRIREGRGGRGGFGAAGGGRNRGGGGFGEGGGRDRGRGTNREPQRLTRPN